MPDQGFFELFKAQVNAVADPVFGGTFIPFEQNWKDNLRLVPAVVTGISMVLSFAGLIFFIYLVVAGYQWMTAGGNEERVDEARSRLRNAVIGLIIVIFAFTITYVVSYFVVSLQVTGGEQADSILPPLQ